MLLHHINSASQYYTATMIAVVVLAALCAASFGHCACENVGVVCTSLRILAVTFVVCFFVLYFFIQIS